MNDDLIPVPVAHFMARVSERPPGYLEATLSQAACMAEGIAYFTPEAYARLLEKYRGDLPVESVTLPCCGG